MARQLTYGRGLFEISLSTGVVLWRHRLDGPGTDPVHADGVVYVGTRAGTVLAVDAETGRKPARARRNLAGLSGGGQRLMWTDTAFLVGSDPDEVLRTVAPPADEDERRTAAVYRSVALRLSRADSVGRAQLLSLEAARFGWSGLAARFASATPPGEPTAPWRVGWATGRRVDERTARVMRCDGVHAALAVRNGRLVAVDAGPFGEVRALDVLDGTSTGLFKAPQDARVVGSVEAGGKVLVLTGHEVRDRHWNTDRQGPDDTMRAWDLSAGEPVGEPLTVAHGRLTTVATVRADGRTLLVSGGWDGLVRVWDPATGREVAEPAGGHQGRVPPLRRHGSRAARLPSPRGTITITSWSGTCSAATPSAGH
ncbi:PQQ-binding-like beta-propeller repeat protein [Streptomyces sp. NPDC056930]|uniref:outer membrane protein assembly factor BamB family protein n=1 Tax=Streptomyces sp. NPDC056930 TaxID=3345967 RepID=UPI00362B6AEC